MKGHTLVQEWHTTGLEPAPRTQNTMLERCIAILQYHIINNMLQKNAKMLETTDPKNVNYVNKI